MNRKFLYKYKETMSVKPMTEDEMIDYIENTSLPKENYTVFEIIPCKLSTTTSIVRS